MSPTATAAAESAPPSVAAPPAPLRRSAARDPWRAIVVRGASLALGLVGALVGLEVLLWFLGYEPTMPVSKRYLVREDATANESFLCYESNPQGAFQPVPETWQGRWRLMSTMLPPERLPLDDLRQTPWCVRYQLNSYGFRDVELAPLPAAGTTRLALVGDSFVFGEGVPDDQTLSRQLAPLLGSGIECVNAGRPGLNTAQEVARVRHLVDEWQVRRAVVVFIANDIGLAPELAQRQKFIFDLMNFRDQPWQAQERARWLGSSRLWRMTGSKWGLARVTRDTIRWYQDSYDPRFNAAELDNLAAQFHALARVPECPVALVLFPLLEGLESEYPLANIHRRVEGLAADAGLPVLDLAPTFAGQPTSELWVHPTDHHPNGRALGLAAEAIAEWLPTITGFLPRGPEPAPSGP